MAEVSNAFDLVGNPCKNFNILASVVINDPWDGREKLVLSNFALGETGNLIFIDTMTGEGESFLLPGDDGAWGLVNYFDEKLIVGTCPNHAYLHCLDLRTRRWAEPLQDGKETYLWNLTVASDGKVYGGTYPGCVLLRYDPALHKMEHLGRVSDNLNNLYSRHVTGARAGTVFISGGFETPFLKAYDIETDTYSNFGTPGFQIREITDDFICTENENAFEFFDPRTLEPLYGEDLRNKVSNNAITLSNGKTNKVLRLKDGRLAGVRGQDYFITDGFDSTPELRRIPTPAPATMIHTLAADKEGRIWGACAFGQTIFRYDPRDGAEWNSSGVCDNGGEVYGMQFIGSKLFMSAYSGGDHIVYDTEQPWNQLDNVNPRTLRSLKEKLIRPTGRTVLGPDGGVWTGWSAKYGVYGGGLSRIDPDTLEVDDWYDPVGTQQVAGLTADETNLYFTTNGGASGLAYKEGPCHFAVWSHEGRVIHLHRFEDGVKTGSGILALNGRVFVGVGKEIRVFDPQTLSFTRTISTGSECSWMVEINDRLIGAFCENGLYLIPVSGGEAVLASELPGTVIAAALAGEEQLYFAVNSDLYRMTITAEMTEAAFNSSARIRPTTPMKTEVT